IVASSSTATTNAGIAVLLNQFGTGFGTPIQSDVAPGTALQNVVVSDINGDGVPDLILSTAIQSGSVSAATTATPINVTVNNGGNLSNGQTVTIAGVLGNLAANGTWTIANVGGGFGGTHFAL